MSQFVPDQCVEMFLAGLWHTGNTAQHRTAMAGQIFQIKHLRTAGCQCVQQAGFARPRGPCDDAQMQSFDQARNIVQHGRSKCFVAAFNQPHPKTYLPEHQS